VTAGEADLTATTTAGGRRSGGVRRSGGGLPNGGGLSTGGGLPADAAVTET
jgi:hypothetical protein